MIPLSSNIRRLYPPVATAALVAGNAIVFLVELSLPVDQLDRAILAYGVVPARQTWALAEAPGAVGAWLVPAFTSMFLHGGWAHLLGNMLFLWVFGSRLEGRIGTLAFAALYASAGVVAGQLQVAVDPLSPVPMIGASGAIAGALGAYLWLFPLSRVTVAIPIVIVPVLVELPAVVVLGVWLVEQVWLAALSALSPTASAAAGVAWWAHVGGFAAGVITMWGTNGGRRA